MRRLGYWLLVSAMALTLAACAEEAPLSAPKGTLAATQAAAEPTAVQTEPAPEVPRTVVSAVVARNSQKTEQWWAEFEQHYEQADPLTDLQITCVARQDVDAAVRQRIAAGMMPDLVNTEGFETYRQQGLLLPAQEWVSRQTYGKFYTALHDRITVDGTVWGIPDWVTARALYYNKDILNAAAVAVPATWAELTTACQMLRNFDYELWPWGVDMTTDEGYATFAYYIWNNGSDFVDAQGSWTLDDRKNLEALEFITGMVNARLTNPDPTAQTRYDCQTLFGQGKIAMMIAPSTLTAYCAAEGTAVNSGIAPLPANGSNPSVSTASGDFFLCLAREGRTPGELDAITRVVDALYEDTSYARRVQGEGFLPATTTANALLGEKDPHMAVWNEILGSLKFYPARKESWGSVKEGSAAALQYTLWEDNAWLQLDKLQKSVSE